MSFMPPADHLTHAKSLMARYFRERPLETTDAITALLEILAEGLISLADSFTEITSDHEE
jgi:hypothetical protein